MAPLQGLFSDCKREHTPVAQFVCGTDTAETPVGLERDGGTYVLLDGDSLFRGPSLIVVVPMVALQVASDTVTLVVLVCESTVVVSTIPSVRLTPGRPDTQTPSQQALDAL